MSFNLKIKKLFNKKDYNIYFENHLNIMIGENGCGKSTIINIIYNIATKNFQYLSSLSFDEICLSFDRFKFEIKKEDIKQLEITKNPAFRSTLFNLDLSTYLSFDEFYNSVINLQLPKYNYLTNEYETTLNYLNDDIYYANQEYYEFMSKYNLIYGSRIYLWCFYCFFKRINPFSELEKIVKNAQIYSFVNIDDTDNLKIELDHDKETKCINCLSKYFEMKKIYFEDCNLFIQDDITNDIISENNLSSGERKIIKIIQLLVSSENTDFLLLDEPELSLSIYWQRYLIEDIISICKSKKIIIATQSPNLLNVTELDYLIPIYSDESDLDE